MLAASVGKHRPLQTICQSVQALVALLSVVVSTLIFSKVFAQQGNSIITNYLPSEYSESVPSASPQNFDVLQDERGILYSANATSVLFFDGQSWGEVEGTKNLKFLKLVMDDQGRIFSGGEKELGYILPDGIGVPRFVSLKDKLPKEASSFESIVRIVFSGGRVFFMSKKVLLAWDGNKFSYWLSEGGFLKIFGTEECLFVIENGSISKVVDGELSVLTTNVGSGIDIRSVLPLRSSSDTLIVTSINGLYLLKGDTLSHLPSALDGVKCFNAIGISDDLIAVGTSENGCYLIAPNGRVIRQINEATGLMKGPILSPRRGSDNSLLLGLSTGIARVEHQSPISIFDASRGVQSFALSSLKTEKGLYVGTRRECLFLPKASDEAEVVQFAALPISTSEVFGILSFREDVIVGAWTGIHAVNEKSGKVAKLTSDQNLTSICRSQIDTNRIWYATPDKAIRSIYYDNGHWKDEGEVARVPHRVYNLAESAKGELWASYDGVSLITFTGGREGATVRTLDSAQGVAAEMGLIEVNDLGGKIVFGTERGIHLWDGSKLVPDPTYGEAFSNGSRIAYNLTATRKGDVWVTTNHQTGLLRLQPNGSFVYDSLPIIRAEISDVFSIYEDPDGVVWFGGTEALVRYDPSVAKDYHAPFHALVRSVMVNSDSLLFAGNYANADGVTVREQPASYVHVLPFACNHLTFFFSAPFFEYPEKLRYSYQLVGQDDDWSKWGTGTIAEYTNLSEGDYVFKVRARNVYGTISTVAEYRFTILAPWYRTIWAYLVYALLAIVMLVLAARINTWRLLAAKHRLERIVEERTAEVRQQREEIRQEKEMTDRLLLNILPRETANELKLNQSVKPQKFDVVTVLFADIRDFTHISHSLDPEDLVRELNYIFTQMDEIVGKHSLEKIKTIGDAYMCAGGLPVPDDNHPVNTVRAALEMQEFMETYNEQREKEGKPRFDIRIGIHSGPVVAGIVGTRKFQYDIWGDTVNTASRLESSGEPKRVNISESTYELVKDHFKCTWRGKNLVKNRGEIGMYFVDR